MKIKRKKLFYNILNNEDKSEILKKGISFLFFRFAGILSGYIFTFLIAKYYGASVNGLVALSFTLFLIISIFGKLGIETNLIKYYSVEKNQNENPGLLYIVIATAIFFSIFLSGTLYYFKDYISNQIFNKPQLEPYLIWTSLAITPWVIVVICSGYFRALKLNNHFAFFNNSGRFIFSLIFLLFIITYSNNELDPIKSHFFGLLTLSFFALFFVIIKTKKITFYSTEKPIVFLKESFPMMTSTALFVLLGWTDTLFLGVYETDQVLGVYNVALKISAIVALVLEAVNSILAPQIALLYQKKENEKLQSIIRFSTRLIFISSIVIIVILITFHKTLLSFFGEEFLKGSVFFLILCIGPIICAFCGSVAVIIQMVGKQKALQNFLAIAFIINLTLNFILTPIYGGVGAAISTVTSVFIWNFLGARYLRSRLGIISYLNFKKT